MAGVVLTGAQAALRRKQRPEAYDATGQVYNADPRMNTYPNQQHGAQGNWNASRSVQQARDAGISASSSYTDPLSGVTYNYSTDGSGGGAGGRRGAGGGFDIGSAMVEINPMLPTKVPRQPMPARVAPPPQANREAAERAAYGRAKDLIGQNAGGAMKALTRQMSARGIRGSGLEAAGVGNVIGGAQGQLGEVARSQAIEGLKRDWAVEDRNMAAELAQRSGDMSWLTTERGQDIDQEQFRASQIPGLLRLIRESRTGVAY